MIATVKVNPTSPVVQGSSFLQLLVSQLLFLSEKKRFQLREAHCMMTSVQSQVFCDGWVPKASLYSVMISKASH